MLRFAYRAYLNGSCKKMGWKMIKLKGKSVLSTALGYDARRVFPQNEKHLQR